MANEPTLDEALQAAHLPALAVALVQLTGDTSWLRMRWWGRLGTPVPEGRQTHMSEITTLNQCIRGGGEPILLPLREKVARRAG